jgi:hypothetical protein
VRLAGVLYHGQGKPALGLRLRETLWLKPQPENPYDKNAVLVATARGETVGHLPRYLAKEIAPALASGGVEQEAVVTGLRTDPAGRAVGVTIAFRVGAELAPLPIQAIEYSVEPGDGGAVYIFLNSTAAVMDEIQDELELRGCSCERVGQAFRPAADGNAYQWYLRMAEGVTGAAVEAYFAEAHGLRAWRPPSNEAVSDYADAFDGELAAKEEQIAKLVEQLRRSEEQTRDARQRLRHAGAESLSALVGAVMPQVAFLRDSWDVLTKEVEDPEDVLREAHSVCCSPEGVPAKTVQGAPGWRELRYNTGQKDNGRLYFRRDGESVEMLVSFKGAQERDIRYLKAL